MSRVNPGIESEVLVTVQLRFPALDRRALADHLSPILVEAITAGGSLTSFSIQGYEPNEDAE
jgi:hypothetical protein